MSNNDRWDVFNILVNKGVLIAIPIVLGFYGNKISQSIEKAKLIESLLDDLTTNEVNTRRDIALIALDSAVSPSKNESESDQVVEISKILLTDIITRDNPYIDEQTSINKDIEKAIAVKIIKKRKPNSGEVIIKDLVEEIVAVLPSEEIVSSANPNAAVNQNDSSRKERIDNLIADILPADVKRVYIQYKDDKQNADIIREHLREQNISVALVQKIEDIQQVAKQTPF